MPADGRRAVVEVDLDELQLELRALVERGRGRQVVAAALGEHLEVVDVRMARGGDEVEPPTRRLLERREPRPARAREERQRTRMDGDLVRLDARACPGGGERAKPALDLERDGRVGDDDAVARARRAPTRHHLARAVRHVLARHLDEAERRDLHDEGLGAVAIELGAEGLFDGLPVLRVGHVDEVDDDDPADVAQPELPHDLLHGLEVVLDRRVLEPLRRALRARADEASRVDVDHRERLGVVEDQVAAGREVDAAVDGRRDLLLDPVALEERLLVLRPVDALDHVRRGLLQIADDPLVGAVGVDVGGDEVTREEVADDPERELCLLIDELGRLGRLRAGLDRLPEPLQEDQVALDVLGGGPLGRGAHDHAARCGGDLLEDVLEPLALPVLEPARDAEPFPVRDVDQEPAGERDLRGQPRALRLHRVLDRLDEDLLAALDQVGDLLAVPGPLELGDDDLVDVEEPVLLEADLDERRLHAGQHVVDRAQVDVPRDRPPLGALEVDLRDLVVLEQGDALLADVDGDQQLALRRRQWRAALRRTPAVLAAGALAAAATLPLAVLLLRPLGGRLRPLGGGHGLVAGLLARLACGRARLLPAAPASRAAAALRAGSCLGGRRALPCLGRRGRRLSRGARRLLDSHRLCRCLLVVLASSKPEPGQESCLLVLARAGPAPPERSASRCVGCERRWPYA